jgi:hypothetical protein
MKSVFLPNTNSINGDTKAVLGDADGHTNAQETRTSPPLTPHREN